jgi:hypothetical protein
VDAFDYFLDLSPGSASGRRSLREAHVALQRLDADRGLESNSRALFCPLDAGHRRPPAAA